MSLNFGILIGPFIIAVVYPHVGKIAAILGAIGAFLCIYTLPTVTFAAQKKTEVDNPELMAALRANDFAMSPPKPRRKRASLYKKPDNIDGDAARKQSEYMLNIEQKEDSE